MQSTSHDIRPRTSLEQNLEAMFSELEMTQQGGKRSNNFPFQETSSLLEKAPDTREE